MSFNIDTQKRQKSEILLGKPRIDIDGVQRGLEVDIFSQFVECIYEEEANHSPKSSPVKIDVTEIEGLAEILQDSEEFEFEEENECLQTPGVLNFEKQDFDLSAHFEISDNKKTSTGFKENPQFTPQSDEKVKGGLRKLNPAAKQFVLPLDDPQHRTDMYVQITPPPRHNPAPFNPVNPPKPTHQVGKQPNNKFKKDLFGILANKMNQNPPKG